MGIRPALFADTDLPRWPSIGLCFPSTSEASFVRNIQRAPWTHLPDTRTAYGPGPHQTNINSPSSPNTPRRHVTSRHVTARYTLAGPSTIDTEVCCCMPCRSCCLYTTHQYTPPPPRASLSPPLTRSTTLLHCTALHCTVLCCAALLGRILPCYVPCGEVPVCLQNGDRARLGLGSTASCRQR